MKMIKSLILGSTAGLIAMSGAQAADLPVKAKAVEYVKVCNLYGAGFWYVPGTDTCMKIGAFLRTSYGVNANGTTPISGGAGRFDRTDTTFFAFQIRSAATFDVRTQTDYGTLRSY